MGLTALITSFYVNTEMMAFRHINMSCMYAMCRHKRQKQIL